MIWQNFQEKKNKQHNYSCSFKQLKEDVYVLQEEKENKEVNSRQTRIQ